MTSRSRSVFSMAMRNQGILAVLAPLLIVGCLGRSPDVRHFVLGAAESPVSVERALEVAVLVGPVRLPAYLDRSQIATLDVADGEVELDEFNRWLGGFEENLVRAISLGLARELGSNRVVAAPSKAPFPFDYTIRLHVDDMVLENGEALRVRVRWALIPRSKEAAPRFFVLDERFSTEGEGPSDIVRAHDVAITALVHLIAEEIAQVEVMR